MRNTPVNIGKLGLQDTVSKYVKEDTSAGEKLKSAGIGSKPTLFITLPGPGAPIKPEQMPAWKTHNLAGCTGFLELLVKQLEGMAEKNYQVVVLTSMTAGEFALAEQARLKRPENPFSTKGITFIHDPELDIANALAIDTVTACERTVYPAAAGLLDAEGQLTAVVDGLKLAQTSVSRTPVETRKSAEGFLDETIAKIDLHPVATASVKAVM